MWPPFYLSSNHAVFLDLLTKLLAGCCQSLFGYLPSTQELFGDYSHSLLVQQIPIRRNCKNKKLKRKRTTVWLLSKLVSFSLKMTRGLLSLFMEVDTKVQFPNSQNMYFDNLISNKMVHLVKVPLKQWLVVKKFSDCVILQNSD